MRTLIIGGGISGLTAALFLAQRGEAVELWEATSKPGGLVRPVSFRGLRFDLGSHRVHPEAVTELASLGVLWRQKQRRGVLVLQERHIEYPPSFIGFLRGLGLENSLRFGLSFLTKSADLQKFQSWERDRADLSRTDIGFADFVRERAGRAAYEAFYRPYAEKVFGVEASLLSQSVAKKRVSTEAPLSSLVSSFLSPKKYFLYPAGGLSAVLDLLMTKLESLGVQIQFNKTFTKEDLPCIAQYKRALYAGYPQLLAPESALSYRGLYVLYLSFPVERLSGVDTFYIPEREYWFGRVSEPQNFSEGYQQRGETVVCVEIPEAQFGPNEDFVKKLDEVMRQLHTARIIPKSLYPKEAKQVFLPKVYPLYLRGWPTEWQRTMKTICGLGSVLPFGRQGLFLHCNIDHCVQISRDLVKHIAENKSPEEWVSSASRYLDVRVRD